jgi:hypothetical protein
MSELEKVIVYPQYAGFADLMKPFGAQDDVPDAIEDDVEHFVSKFWHTATVAALAKTDKPITVLLDMSVPTSDIDDDDAPLYKLPAIVKDDGRRTLGKRLGIVRSEEVTNADGDTWLHGFGADGQLIDARLIKSA